MESSLGEQLKQIRESQGIALETIALKTHIPLAHLQALEAGDVDLLPSKVQLRGFLRLYAHEMGLELDDLSVSGDYLAEKEQGVESKGEAGPPEEDPSLAREDSLQSEVLTPLSEAAPGTEDEMGSPHLPSADLEPGGNQTSSDERGSEARFIAIGSQIKAQRESLSLSIDGVHENLHIPVQHLVSIEAGRFEQLPSPVQAKGLLLNYADFLNLNTETLLSDYADALQLRRIENQDALLKQGKRAARELSPNALRIKNFFTLDLLVITVLFLAFATFVIWGVNRILASGTPESTENDIPDVSDVLLAAGTPTPAFTSEDEDEKLHAKTEASDQEEPMFTPFVSLDPINIILVPRQRLWAQITVDGEQTFQGRLIPGNAYEYSGEYQIDILTGNVGALQILFNNLDIGSQGLPGQVADLSFTPNGLVLPPPTSTPVSTETPQTTPTPPESDG